MRWWSPALGAAGAVALGVAALFFLPRAEDVAPLESVAVGDGRPLPYLAEDCPAELNRALAKDSERYAECGRVIVDESPGERRKVRLYVVRIRARDPDSGAPLLLVAGGPGNSFSSHLDKRLPYLLPLAPRRDILIVDLRGTGSSEPRLDCKEPLPGGDAVASCFRNWSADLNPAAFSTERATYDLKEILNQQRVARVVLYGVSYGTTVALAFARRYQERVEGLVLDSPVPADRDVLAPIGKNAADAIRLLLKTCGNQALCAEAFPYQMDDFVRLVSQLEEQGTGGRPDGAEFTAFISNLMFSPTALRFLPLVLAEAQDGNFSELKRLTEAFSEPSFAMGTHLSVQCAEVFPRTSPAAIRHNDSQIPTPLRSFLSSERYLSYCEAWKMTATKRDAMEVEIDVPTLVLSGRYDHLTPPEYGLAVSAHLRNTVLFTDSTMGHGVAMSDCGAAVVSAFVQALPEVASLSSAHCQEHTARGIEFSLVPPSDAEVEKIRNEVRYRL